MDNLLSILLIEDEPTECQEMIQYIENKEGVQLVGVTNNTEKALEHVAESQPDVVILDLELHKGYGDGLTFLESLREKRLPYPVYVFVTTNNISHVTHNGARKMGADFIMVKSQDDYSAKRVIEFLCSLKNIIHSNKKIDVSSVDTDIFEQRQRSDKNKVITELNRIGISSSMLGRVYLLDSIMLLIENRNERFSAAVSEKYGKSAASVERAMQSAIEKAWKTTHIDDLEEYYTAPIHSSKGVPTMSEFIYYYVEKIKNEH